MKEIHNLSGINVNSNDLISRSNIFDIIIHGIEFQKKKQKSKNKKKKISILLDILACLLFILACGIKFFFEEKDNNKIVKFIVLGLYGIFSLSIRVIIKLVKFTFSLNFNFVILVILVIGNLIFLVWSVILENENIFVIIIIIIMEIVILGNSFIEIEKKKHKRLNNTV